VRREIRAHRADEPADQSHHGEQDEIREQAADEVVHEAMSMAESGAIMARLDISKNHLPARCNARDRADPRARVTRRG
jgi:hypothetical protein